MMIEYPKLGETLTRRRLSNGLEIVVVHKPYHAKSYAVFATRYGGMDLRFSLDGKWQETPAGIAHFLEHKMFDMPDGSASQMLALNGAVDNAFTSNAITAYYFQSTEKFYDNLRILLDFVSTPYFTEESVDKEQGIIAQEIRMVEDDPEWRVYSNLMECLFENHPVRVAVAGTVDSIGSITPETLYDCHKAFYSPANMVLVCVGDMDADRVAAIAEEILPKESGPSIERDYGADEGCTPACKEKELVMEVSMPLFLGGYKCSADGSEDDLLRLGIIGDMACDILFGDSSPLFNRLYEEGVINGSLGGNFDMLPGAAYLYVGGDTKEPRRVFEEITREAERIADEGIDEAFYQQIRCATYGQMIRSLNSFENIAVSTAEGYFRGFDYYHFPEVFETITKTEVESFIRDNIRRENSAISIIQPAQQEN